MIHLNHDLKTYVSDHLDVASLTLCGSVCKEWRQYFDHHIDQYYSEVKGWIVSEQQLLNNQQVVDYQGPQFEDFCFVPDMGLMFKLSFVIDASKNRRLVLQLITFHRLNKILLIDLPKDFKDESKCIYYSFELFWDQGAKVAMTTFKDYYLTIDLSNLVNINHEFIKRTKNNKRFKQRFSNWYDQKIHKVFDHRNESNVMTVKQSKTHISFKCGSKKATMMPYNYPHNKSIITFGNKHEFTMLIAYDKCTIFDSRNPSAYQILHQKIKNICSFYYDDESRCLNLITSNMLIQFTMDDKHQWSVSSQPKKESVDWIFGKWCQRQKRFIHFKPSMITNDAFVLDNWIKVTKPHHLRIKDILQLKEGDEIELIQLDRNVHDTCENANPYSTIVPAESFFRDSLATYTHRSGMSGVMDFQDAGFVDQTFEFHVNYEPGCWYPFNNGALPLSDPQGFLDLGSKGGWKWEQFPSETRIGWRGPMIKKSLIKDLHDVYWLPNDPTLLH